MNTGFLFMLIVVIGAGLWSACDKIEKLEKRLDELEKKK